MLLNAWVVLATLALLQILHFLYLVVYRLYFHPLAGFPGSKLAAATGWYEFYFDFWKNGKYVFEIEKMHKQYGPIIRVNPMEISIHDPDFYNEVYVVESKRRTEHYENFVQGIDFDGCHLLTKDHGLHRVRRKPLEPFFSRMGIQKLQPMLADVALKMERRLRDMEGTNRVVRLDHVFSAFSGDIVGRICSGYEDSGHRFLEDAEFAPYWYNVIQTIIRSIPLFMAFPVIIRIVSKLPAPVLLKAYPRGHMFNEFKSVATQRVRDAMAIKEENDRKGLETDDKGSLFLAVANSDMPDTERSEGRLVKEAQLLLGGGTAGTARTIGFASFYILDRPEILEQLRNELHEPMRNWPDTCPSWADLERLLYLQAVIKESLRLSYGVMHRLPRVSPDLPIQYKEYAIPPGTPVGMSSYLMQSDPEVYPEPEKFIPDRWLGKIDPRMNRNWVPFSKGSRNCLGINLAMAEMSLALAVLFRPGAPALELYETDESDVKQAHDFLVPVPRIDTKGIRAIIR